MGGKGRGLAFIDSVLKRNYLMHHFEGITLTIPRTVVLSTDVFDEFMEINNLYPVAMSDISNEEILRHFLNAAIPSRIHKDLFSFISVARNPIAIRSSSLLEDSHYQPFAGIYSTYMIPNLRDNEHQMLEILGQAIKCVYASVYYKESKAYMQATQNAIDEERMAIVLQEVVGSTYDHKFYPSISGVARSLNYYPIEPEKPSDGIASIALGLGKYVVEGKPSIRFSPKYPKKLFQLSMPEMALRETQKTFFALDLRASSFVPSTDDAINLLELDIRDAYADGTLSLISSTFDYESQQVREGYNGQGMPIISFSGILRHNQFPLAEILQKLLSLGEQEMNTPVEIEFAVNLNTPVGQPKLFSFLQIRPIVQNRDLINIDIDNLNKEDVILSSDSSLGNGQVQDIYDVVYVKPESFDSSMTVEIASVIDEINQKLVGENRPYILIGPGRWGSIDRWLGIPVKWPQISGAKLIVEAGLENYRIDPSQGTHFFQNLTSFRVGYITVNPYINQGFLDYEYLDAAPVIADERFVKHVRFDEPLDVIINGQNRKAVVLKKLGIVGGEK